MTSFMNRSYEDNSNVKGAVQAYREGVQNELKITYVIFEWPPKQMVLE